MKAAISNLKISIQRLTVASECSCIVLETFAFIGKKFATIFIKKNNCCAGSKSETERDVEND